MWIFCCGMRRAGSTLQYQLVAEIVESLGKGKALGWIEPGQFCRLREEHSGEKGFLVVKCHRYIDEVTDLFLRGEAKAVYVYRDVRDVVVSMMNKNDKNFGQIVRSGLIETVLREYHKWNEVSDISVSRYEDMVANLQKEALKLAEFLELNLDGSRAEELSEQFSIEAQRQRIRSRDFENQGVRYGSNLYDPVSLLHKDHIHSGNSGQWRKALSPLQVAYLEDVTHNWLVDRGYTISQDWMNRKLAAIGYSLTHQVRRASVFARHCTKRLASKINSS